MSDIADRITFRPKPTIAPILASVSENEFGGNLSKLINDWLECQAVEKGHITEGEEDSIYEVVQKAIAGGIDVRALIAEASEAKTLELEATL